MFAQLPATSAAPVVTVDRLQSPAPGEPDLARAIADAIRTAIAPIVAEVKAARAAATAQAARLGAAERRRASEDRVAALAIQQRVGAVFPSLDEQAAHFATALSAHLGGPDGEPEERRAPEARIH
jgi:hypothetical protein